MAAIFFWSHPCIRGGWKLATRQSRNCCNENDVIIRAAIMAHSKRRTRFTPRRPSGLERNSLSGYCYVNSSSTAMGFYDPLNLSRGFPKKHSNTSRIRKSYSGRPRAHLAVATERVLSQTREGLYCKSSSPLRLVSSPDQIFRRAPCGLVEK